MKQSIKDNARTITADILENLYYSIEDLGAAAISKKEAYKQLYGRSQKISDLSETKLGRWIESLRQKKFIKITNNFEGNRSIEFTNKGKLKIIETIGSNLEVDGTYRFLSFDIPEQKRSSRNHFRAAIKKLGFVQIQQSLWVINKNVANIVEMAAYEFGVEKYIVYIVARSSDIDGILNKKFE